MFYLEDNVKVNVSNSNFKNTNAFVKELINSHNRTRNYYVLSYNIKSQMFSYNPLIDFKLESLEDYKNVNLIKLTLEAPNGNQFESPFMTPEQRIYIHKSNIDKNMVSGYFLPVEQIKKHHVFLSEYGEKCKLIKKEYKKVTGEMIDDYVFIPYIGYNNIFCCNNIVFQGKNSIKK